MVIELMGTEVGQQGINEELEEEEEVKFVDKEIEKGVGIEDDGEEDEDQKKEGIEEEKEVE